MMEWSDIRVFFAWHCRSTATKHEERRRDDLCQKALSPSLYITGYDQIKDLSNLTQPKNLTTRRIRQKVGPPWRIFVIVDCCSPRKALIHGLAVVIKVS